MEMVHDPRTKDVDEESHELVSKCDKEEFHLKGLKIQSVSFFFENV